MIATTVDCVRLLGHSRSATIVVVSALGAAGAGAVGSAHAPRVVARAARAAARRRREGLCIILILSTPVLGKCGLRRFSGGRRSRITTGSAARDRETEQRTCRNVRADTRQARRGNST